MSLRLRLRAYLVALHLLLFAFSVALLLDRPLLFVLVEVLLLASLAGGFHLASRALEPLGYTRRFHDLLQDQDYAGRLTRSSVPELDEL
ncbi:MAG: histidine kinase, partial [Massilia sp.]|nr:histidine kinase [Massilia sp.]